MLTVNVSAQEENYILNRTSGCNDFFSYYMGGDVGIDLCDNSDYDLVFEDEFNGDCLDESKWQLRPWGAGSFDGAQEYNKLSNAVVSNGTLKIVAKREYTRARAIYYLPDDQILPDGNPNLRNFFYTSSNLWTKRKFLYGIFEARIKIPKGRGFLPSFWMYGGNKWNEIDIFEFWNVPGDGNYNPTKSASTINMNVHYDYEGDGVTNYCSEKHIGNDYSNDFHIYKLVWSKNKISWYVDGVKIRQYYSNYEDLYEDINPVECLLFPHKIYLRRLIYPKEPMNLIIDLAIDNGDDAPDLHTVFPAEMEIDWVRCYQKISDEDVVINDMSDYHFDDYYANIITGRSVKFDCDFIIDSLTDLEIIGRNEIVLNPGFEAKKGSNVNASITELNEDRSEIDNIDTSLFEFRNKDTKKNIIQDVSLTPNPVSKTLSVHSCSIGLNRCKIVVFDIKGNPVIEKFSNNDNEIIVDVSNISKGVYVVKIIGGDGTVLSIEKIIVQ